MEEGRLTVSASYRYVSSAIPAGRPTHGVDFAVNEFCMLPPAVTQKYKVIAAQSPFVFNARCCYTRSRSAAQ